MQSKHIEFDYNEKNVLFILPSLYGGGVELNTMRLIKELLRNRNLKIFLVLLDDSVNQHHHPNFKVINLGKKHARSMFLKIRNIIKENNIDTVVSAKDYINIITILACISTVNRPKCIISVRADVRSIAAESKNYRDRIIPIIIPFIYPLASHVITVSKHLESEIRKSLKFRKSIVETIYNPIIDENFYDMAAKNISHPWLSANSDVNEIPVVVSVGRLESQKDYPTLLKAMRLLNDFKPVRCIIIGSGSKEEELKNLVGFLELDNNVDFLGNIANPLPYIRNADIFVLSSLYEGLPTVIVEALALGKTVVSTDCPTGPAELLSTGDAGILVPISDPEALADAINNAMTKRAFPCNAANVEVFSTTKSAKAYAKLF